MHITTHLISGWLAAHLLPEHDRRVRICGLLAAGMPDLDAVPIVYDFIKDALDPGPVQLYWYTTLHHVVGHSVFVGLLAAALLTAFTPGGLKRRAGAFVLYYGCFCLHIACDLIGTVVRIQLLWPFSETPSTGIFGLRWPIEAWQNSVVFYVLVGLCLLSFCLWRRSPLEILSARLDPYLHDNLAGVILRRRCARCDAIGSYRCVRCGDRVCGEHATVSRLEARCGCSE